jgi:hypothetical protein
MGGEQLGECYVATGPSKFDILTLCMVLS